MSKLEKNIETVVASKVLKDIHGIVDEDNIKQQQEKRWGFISIFLIVFAALILGVYLMLKPIY